MLCYCRCLSFTLFLFVSILPSSAVKLKAEKRAEQPTKLRKANEIDNKISTIIPREYHPIKIFRVKLFGNFVCLNVCVNLCFTVFLVCFGFFLLFS